MSFLALMCVATLLISTANGDSSDHVVFVRSFFTCRDHPDLPNQVVDQTFNRDYRTNEYFLSGTVQITEEIQQTGSWVNVTIFNCLTDEEGSCSPSMHIEERDLCAHLADSDRVWSTVVDKMQGFRPECPVQPGEFRVEDALLDLSSLDTTLGLPIGYYQIKLLFMHIDEPQMCVMADAQIRTRRRKQNKHRHPGNEARGAGDANRRRAKTTG